VQKYNLEKVILKIGYFLASSMTTTLRPKQPQKKRTEMKFTIVCFLSNKNPYLNGR
jgi:hypothetical protein